MVLLLLVILDLQDAVGGILVLLHWPPQRLLKVVENCTYPLGFLRKFDPFILKQFSFLLSYCSDSDVTVLNRGQLGA